jgi:outer membrane lipoprotein-sorting protein
MKKLILACALLIVSSLPAHANDPFLKKAEDWFNNLKTAKANFTQIGYDGRQATGQFYLKRPGRLRFEYDAPLKDFVVADGIMVHFYDGELEDMSNAPIGQTPADFILRKRLDFTSVDSDLIVRKTEHKHNIFRVVMIQKEDPEAGEIVLDFTKKPMQLNGWLIKDSLGNITQINLDGLVLNERLDPALFVYKDPKAPKYKKHNFNN